MNEKKLTRPLFKMSLGATVAFLIVVTATALIERAEQRRFLQQQHADTVSHISTIRARLEKALNQRLFLTRGIIAYVSAINPDLTQETFATLAAIVTAGIEGIHSISLYKNNTISHVYPLSGNEATLGFSPYSIPSERAAIDRAIRQRQTVVAGPINLVQGGIAFIARDPIFLTPPQQKPESGVYWGLAGTLIDQTVLLTEAGLLDDTSHFQYALRGRDGLGELGEIFFGAPHLFAVDANAVLTTVTLPGGSWQLAAIPITGWATQSPYSSVIWLSGILIALFVSLWIINLLNAPIRLQRAVNQATQSLREQEADLIRMNAHLKKARDALAHANITLEDKVQERTAQLAQANYEITQLNARLQRENSRLEAELDIARHLQHLLLPSRDELAQLPIDIAGFMESADEVGGDYYDVLYHLDTIKSSDNSDSTDPADNEIPNRREIITLSIGDVTGHGLSSGVLALMTQTALRTLCTLQQAGESIVLTPEQFLDAINRTVCDLVQRMRSDKQLTLIMADYQPRTRQLRVYGQHEEVLIVRQDGTLERIDTVDLGFPLGLEQDIKPFVSHVSVTLMKGDVVVFYTDGLTEAMNADRQQYGIERLCALLRRHAASPAVVIQQHLLADVRTFLNHQPLADDLTLLIFKP